MASDSLRFSVIPSSLIDKENGATVALVEVAPESKSADLLLNGNSVEVANPEESIQIQQSFKKQESTVSRRTHLGLSLKGKVCVVTGGASGIGLAISQSIIESGGEVAIVDLDVALAEKQAKSLAGRYQSGDSDDVCPLITAHSADVSSTSAIDEAITSILTHHGRIDHLVTSAGICENFPAISYPHARMKKLWSVNVDGSFNFATAIARHLMARKVGGSIVLIGSMSGSIVNVPQQQTPYNISKAAVRMMVRSLAVEWAGDGIRVNCVSPGYIRTAL